MGFFSGRVTFARFRVNGPSPGLFGPEHLERLEAHAIGKQRTASSDGVEVGWTAGDHILDTRFDLAKNVVNDTLHFCLRVDSRSSPSDLLRAYTAGRVAGAGRRTTRAASPVPARSARRATAPANASKKKRRTAASSNAKRTPLLWDCAVERTARRHDLGDGAGSAAHAVRADVRPAASSR